jgi:hypothetical protein
VTFPQFTFPFSLAAIQSPDEAIYEWTRWATLVDAGGMTLLLGAAGLLLLLVLVWGIYRREARTVSLGKAMLLATLRTVAIVGALLFFLGLEKRSSHEETVPSRVVVLADTSLSMSLPNASSAGGEGATRATSLSALAAESPLLERLAASHEVDLVAFGEASRPIAHLPLRGGAADSQQAEGATTAPPFDRARIAAELAPAGRETHWGDALAETLERYRGLPLSAIIVLTDGGQNMGLDPLVVTEAATKAGVRVHTVGFGPETAPPNLALRELIAPERAFPGDMLTLQGLVQAEGLEGREIEAQLLRRPLEPADSPWLLVDSQTAMAAPAGELATLRFDTVPEEPGRFEYELRLSPYREESTEADNQQRVEVVVVERKTKVLLFAGGPARDYQFLRNQLRRDKSFTVDVFLQTATEGASQDADTILTEFPATPEVMASYDALVAFDPDWSVLSGEQAQLLDQWVARGAGGMVVVPDNYYTPRWGNNPVMQVIRGLYPVRFADRLTMSSQETRPRAEALELQLTREGEESKFLWLADSLPASRQQWDKFQGVFGAMPSMSPKAGATVLAVVKEPSSPNESGLPYIAEHYYGAGQVLALGSAETWRLRGVDPNHFDRFWTQLLRHVSQGRLLQGSPRGKLLVPQDRYDVGATVAVRAMVSDLQFQPATVARLPLVVERPDGGTDTFEMALDPQRPGSYAAELRVVLPGNYQLNLTLPDSDEQISRKIRVSVPQLEIGQATRNQKLLEGVATATQGYYYPTAELALNGSDSLPSVVEASPSEARTYRVRGQIDEQFARRQAGVLLGVIAGALCLEWMIRRLSHLA